MATKFRADNIGSLLRPAELLEARAALRDGRMDETQVRAIEDRSILKALAMQKAAGVQIFTDGEYRRDIFTADITKAMDGLVPGKPVVKFDWQGRGKELAAESKEGNLQYIVGGKLTKKGRFTPHEAPFLKEHAPGPFKVCTPAAMQHAIMRYRPGVSDQFYPTVHDMLQDVAAIMRDEVQALFDEGAAYVQLDAPSYANFFDQSRRAMLKQSGINIEEALDAAVAADNVMIQGIKRNPDTVTGIHFCRGNKRSAWGAEGSYEPIAEKVFAALKMDRYLFEFDSDRAGGFEPLRFVPKGKTVVLGLITTKEPALEPEDELIRRIEQAQKYVATENLAVSTQCGFASAASGNLITWDN
ncbi:MAG TPA: cobalamin-independent methionine synthase II family protein, partial [Candidatus Limnocylindrales bacterium]|nr:cobalamin-independent methionine synthase II family protein [Candidatus Limnocylindrales bacterium]